MVKQRKKIHTITECALFSAIICVLSPFVIPLGPIPFSLSLFAVMFTAMVLPCKKATASVIVYILAGASGVPVFSGFQGGVNILLGPTGGYIWSYVIVVTVISLSGKMHLSWRLVFSFVSLVICYLCGTAQYAIVTETESIWTSLIICVIPFIPLDIIKTAFAVFLGGRVKNILAQQNLI